MSDLDQLVNDFLQLRTSNSLASANESEQELIGALARRITELMAGDFESLMSMMYRLDIEENKIKHALSPGNLEDPAFSLARIIVERQKQRMYTKSRYKQKPMSDFIDFD
ncbi:MAG: hypothetical protein HKN76_14520 [Saprospiraceae bacterium]|nr:hypothetical protein [Saprospiraceae bacterium]